MQSSDSLLDKLPLELLQLIITSCHHPRDVIALASTSSKYNRIVLQLLYENEVRQESWDIVFWAAEHGNTETLKHWAAVRSPEDTIRADFNIFHGLPGALRGYTKVQSLTSPPLHRACFYTPLHVAAMRSQADAVGFLLDNGAEIDAPGYSRDWNGLSLFRDFRDRARPQVDGCAMLLPLHLAITYGHTEIAKLLLSRGADIAVRPMSPGQSLDITALHLAAGHGLLPIVRILGERPDVDVNRPDIDGQPPLLYAAQNKKGHASMAVLKELGANLDAVLSLRDMPVQQSLLVTLIRGSKWEAAAKLIELGASVQVEDGQRPLMEECERAQMGVVHPEVPDLVAWENLIQQLRRALSEDGDIGSPNDPLARSTTNKASGFIKSIFRPLSIRSSLKRNPVGTR
ncbi:ankyrin repeat-containing domain protein [Xylariales sp. PMI_506]|nr:ankyrin repeat-containing domain protein [Xylariales sp. PMI_506]